MPAVWHNHHLYVPELDADPFAPQIEQVGTPIALGAQDEAERLQHALLATVRDEVALADAGVSCPIKTVADTSCHACPLYRDDDSSAARLCAIGREQERLCTELTVIRLGR